jgi:predicted nucleic acid-binding protein
MSWVNAGEVHYVVARRASPQVADQVISQLGADVDLVDSTGPRTIAAAGIKATHRMSYADCFAVATALEFRVPLITSDPEIIRANVPGLEVIDLRGA